MYLLQSFARILLSYRALISKNRTFICIRLQNKFWVSALNFKRVQVSWELTLLFKIKNFTINTLLPTWNRFHYSTSMEIWGPGSDKFVEDALCFCLISDDFLLQEVVQVLEKRVISWRQVWWITWMGRNFVAEFFQFPEHPFWNVRSGIIMKLYWSFLIH